MVGQEAGAITPFPTIPLRACSICSQYSVGTFHLAPWMGRTEGLVLMVYIPDMLPMVSKELGKAHFKETMYWATAVEGGVIVTLGFYGFEG